MLFLLIYRKQTLFIFRFSIRKYSYIYIYEFILCMFSYIYRKYPFLSCTLPRFLIQLFLYRGFLYIYGIIHFFSLFCPDLLLFPYIYRKFLYFAQAYIQYQRHPFFFLYILPRIQGCFYISFQIPIQGYLYIQQEHSFFFLVFAQGYLPIQII